MKTSDTLTEDVGLPEERTHFCHFTPRSLWSLVRRPLEAKTVSGKAQAGDALRWWKPRFPQKLSTVDAPTHQGHWPDPSTTIVGEERFQTRL